MHELQLVELVVVQGTAVHVVKAFQCQETVVTITGTGHKDRVPRGRLQSVGQQELSYSIFPASQSTACTCTLSLLH